MGAEEKQQNHRASPSPVRVSEPNNTDGHAKRDTKLIDLNIKPHKLHEQSSNNQVTLSLIMFMKNDLKLLFGCK